MIIVVMVILLRLETFQGFQRSKIMKSDKMVFVSRAILVEAFDQLSEVIEESQEVLPLKLLAVKALLATELAEMQAYPFVLI